MWQFKEKACPKCGIDLTGVEPERIGGEERHPYSVCPNCGRPLPVADIKPEPEPEAKPEPEAPETPETVAEAEPESEAPGTTEAEPTEPEPAA